MLKTMTAAGEGTGRTQPINGLDALLVLPGKAGKSAPAHTGNAGSSSFEQILTEDLQALTAAAGQSLPANDAKALPPAAENKPATDLSAQVTTAGNRQLPQWAPQKTEKGKEESQPETGVDPTIIISLVTAAPFLPGNLSATTLNTDAGGAGKLAPGEAAAPLLLNKIVKMERQILTEVTSHAEKDTPLAKKDVAAPSPVLQAVDGTAIAKSDADTPSLIPASEGKANQAVASAMTIIDTLEKMPSDKQTATPPAATIRAREELEIGLSRLQIPPELVRQAADGTAIAKSDAKTPALIPAVASKANQAAVPSMTTIYTPEKVPLYKQAAAPPAAAIRAREELEIGLSRQQTPLELVRQAADGTATAKSDAHFPSRIPAVEVKASQAAVPAMTMIDTPEKMPLDKQAAVPPAAASRAREELGVGLSRLQTLPELVRQAADGTAIAKTDAKTPSLTPAVENIPHPAAAVSAAIIGQPEKATGAAGRQTAEITAKTDGEREAILLRTIGDAQIKTGLNEFMTSQGEGKKEAIQAERGKSRPREQFAVSEASTTPQTVDMNVNRNGSLLTNGQNAGASTGSLLEQVAEQLPLAISKGSGRVRISLEPENLGKLDMDLVVRENRVQIVLTAESRTVQQTLQGNVEQLRDALRQQGLEVNGFNVLLQNGHQGQGDQAGGNFFWSGHNRGAAENKGTAADDFPAATTSLPGGYNLNSKPEGINIFA